ncbi:MAG: hypothetical protein K0R39_64 [Symbiobacteriaceae bacterium]|nr:hypothetical protein [Symbiobacteriaceae bacterium]
MAETFNPMTGRVGDGTKRSESGQVKAGPITAAEPHPRGAPGAPVSAQASGSAAAGQEEWHRGKSARLLGNQEAGFVIS